MRLLIPVLFCAVCAAALHAAADVTPEEWTHPLLPGAKINPYVSKVTKATWDTVMWVYSYCNYETKNAGNCGKGGFPKQTCE